MSGEIKGLTVEEQALQARLNQKLAGCKTEDEAYSAVMRELGQRAGGSAELDEEALALVTGGMSNKQALKIVSTVYWDLCVKGKERTYYPAGQIIEAMRICDRLDGNAKATSWAIMKRALSRLGFAI